MTDKQSTAQRKRFYALLSKLNLPKLGEALALMIATDTYNTNVLLTILCSEGIDGNLEHSPHLTYRDILEREALSAHFDGINICLN